MLIRTARDGVVYYVSPLLQTIGVPHAFSTRIGGISTGPFESLNLGNPTGVEQQDSWDNIYRNYEILQRAIGVGERSRCWVHQVHGGDVCAVDTNFESGGKADAMITCDPSRLLSVRVADCIPILLSSLDGKVVAAVHAGWRGVVAKIAAHAIEQMQVDADKIVCAIGPHIGYDAFEVGAEVLAEFDPKFCRRREDGKGFIDLQSALVEQLMKASVPRDQIDLTDRCTYRDTDEFFSHRRDKGITGRMAAMIACASPENS